MRILYFGDEMIGFKNPLSDLGFVIDVIPSFEEVLTLSKAARHDLILLNIDWTEKYCRLCEIKKLNNSLIPVVVLGATKDLAVLKETALLGVADYLVKEGLSVERLATRLNFVQQRAQQIAEKNLELTQLRSRKRQIREEVVEAIKPFIHRLG